MTTFLQRYDVSAPSFADRRKSLSSPTSLAHRLLLFLAVMLMGVNSAWADPTTIFDAAASEWTSATLTSGTTTVGSVTWHGGGSAAIDKGGTVDGITWGKRLKLGGQSTFQKNDEPNLARVLSFTAPSAGTVKVYAVTGSNGSDRYVYISQSITSTNRDESTALVKQNTNPASVATAPVTAGTVYVWAGDNIGIYGITFEAGGSSTTYTVSYNLNGHGETISNTTGVTALPNPLPTPSASGYTFGGWYTNSGLTNAAVAGATITANTTLYAKWTEETPDPASIADWDQTYSNQTNGKKGFTYAPTIPVGAGSLLTFEKGVRYSKWVINSRINQFGESTNSNNHGLGVFTEAGAQTTAPTNPKKNIHYVPGFVAEGILEAIDYYRSAEGDAGEDFNIKPWFYAVQNWGITYDMSSGTKKGDELDGMSSVKIYSLLKKFAVNSTFPDGTKNTNATTQATSNARFADALNALKTYNTTRVITSTTNANAAGGWWHKSTYENEMWCDGQYMGPATLAHIINDSKGYTPVASTGTDWDLITNQINISWNYLWNSTDNLLYHGFSATPTSDTWATMPCSYDNKCSTNPAYWARGNGWYVLALVEILQQMERAGQGSSANATNLKGKLNSLVAGIVARQDATSGVWYQVINKNASNLSGNYLESSASAIFLTAIMRAQRLGYLTTDYTTQIKKGYEGFVNTFLASDGNGGINVLNSSCSASLKAGTGTESYYASTTGEGSPQPATDYSEGKGLGAFIMAAVEYERLYLEEPACVLPHSGVTVGELDQSTGFWNAATEATAITKREARSFTFNNHGNNALNWNNWNLVISTSETQTTEWNDAANKLILRADNYLLKNELNGTVTFKVNDIEQAPDWATFRSDMQNAAVTASVTYNHDGTYSITVTSDCGVRKYTEEVTTTTASDGTMYVYFVVDNSHFTNYEVKNGNTAPSPTTGYVDDGQKVIHAPIVNNEREETRYTLGLPSGATASISNAQGLDAKIENGVLIYKSPSAGTHVEMMIRITAEDGITFQDYTVCVETASAPVDDTTIFSMEITASSKQYAEATSKTPAFTSEWATINGGDVYYYNSEGSQKEIITSSKQLKIGNNASYVQIDLSQPLKNGDIINFTEGSNQICFTTTPPRNTSIATTSNTYTITDGDGLAGATTLYVWRVSSTPTIKTLTINRPAPKAHTVTFNVNGHTGNSFAAETESEIGAGVTLPKPTPYAGYTFLGWSTNQSATAADNDLWAYVDKYYPAQDVTLYAVYRQNPIGSQHTPFWKSFSDFVKLENGKAYTATFNNEGGDASYKNWVLIATSNANGHNGDGVQNDGSNEIFCLRADGGYWSPSQAVTRAGKVYRYDSAATTCEEIDATTDADFVTDMSAGDANVRFSLSRVNDKLYLYAVTTCANEAQYVQTWESDVIEGNIYLSFTTDFSKISSLNGNTKKAANLIVKETGGLTQNGTVDDIISLEGVSLMGKGVAEGTEFKVKTTPAEGYELDAVYVNETGYWESTKFPMPAAEAVVGASFKTTQKATYSYTVKAVNANGTVLKTIATGTCTEGDAVTVAYPQYILIGKTLYGIRNNSTGDYYRTTFTPDQDNYVLNLTYNYNNKKNVVYYTEAEDISGITQVDYVNRASNGKVAYSNSAVATAATLNAGSYQIFIRGLNGNSTARTATFTDGTNTLATLSIEQGTNILKNSAVFTLDSQKTIHVSCEGSNQSGLDWFYIQEVNALNVTQNEQKFGFTTTNVEANKYATADGADISDTKTYDGVTGQFYNIKTTSNYVEISEMNAIAFKVYAVHGNGKDTRTVNVYVDDTYVGSISVTPGSGVSSQVFTIPGNKADIHNIRLTGDKGNSGNIYAADIVFYNQKTAPTITPTNVSVSALQTKQFDVTALDGCTITSMQTVSSDVAEVTYDEGKLTVQGKKAGQLTATFNIDASGSSIFEGTTATVNITVTKADLVMKYNPDSYTVNADEETPELPAYELEYYVVEDDVERKLSPVPSVSVTYSTDDASVATVSNGQISLTPNASGSANITATSAANDIFNAAKAYFTINITKGIDYKVSSKPSVNEKFEVSKDGTTYVYGTYGGWKRNSHAYEYNDAETGAKKTRTDDWKAVETYNNAIDGFSKYSNGVNDAMNEDMAPNTDAYYGVKRNGWFESPLKLQSVAGDGTKTYNVGATKPFSLPVRGTYMTFEPTVNGQLTIYILQNGAWNSAKDDVTDNDGYLVSVGEDGKKLKFPGMAPWQFRPHSFHVVDQNGMPIALYTDFKINTKQPIQSGIITEEQLNSKKDGKNVYTDAQKTLVRKFCDTYSVKLGEKFKCISDPTADGYNDVTNICNWKEFKDYMSEGEQARVIAAWNTGVNGAQQVVEMDNGSFLAIDECIMKYSFYVAAGQTYYLFSNFSKMGFSGCNFVPDTDESAHPRATMTLSDVEEYTAPTLDATVGNGNNVKNISVPQYETITLNRSFTGGNWETICLPFTMTEKEVEDNFGAGTELIIMNGTSISGTALNVNFVYHEIQSILAGYPYLIKPTKSIGAITVNNKVIDTATTLTTFDGGDYTFTGISGYSTANVTSPSSNKSGYSVLTNEGDVFLSGNKLYISQGKSVIKGYRAYIQLKDGVTPQAKSVALSFGNIWDEDNDDNNVSTILHGVEADDIMDMTGFREANGVYNLKGQKVGNTMNNLPAGIYVINGKKTVIK